MRLVFQLVLILLVKYLYAQDKPIAWFPNSSNFPQLEYDLLETQVYTGVLYLKAEKENYQGAYIPVNLGIRKSLLAWSMFFIPFDLSFGAASYTQFEIIRYDANTLRGGLLNTDFKASAYLNSSKGAHKFRMQIFHISSHLGDDYILRNESFEWNNKKVNYEQLDISYLYQFKNLALYIGLGEVITPNVYRKRFMMESGFQGILCINKSIDLSYGSDIKWYDENDFIPDIHSAFGVTFNKESISQMNLSMDSFFGHMPYSTIDYGRIFWIGMSLKIYI